MYRIFRYLYAERVRVRAVLSVIVCYVQLMSVSKLFAIAAAAVATVNVLSKLNSIQLALTMSSMNLIGCLYLFCFVFYDSFSHLLCSSFQ